MRLVDLSEINALEDGEPIPAIEGDVKMVFARETDTGQYGEYSKQNFILTNGETEVTVQAWGHDDLQDLVKKHVRIESHKSDKFGLVGIKKNVFESKGKVYHNVKLTGSCKIHSENNGSEKEADATCPTHSIGPKEEPRTSNAARTVQPAGAASALDERQRAIIRQHSQSMALEVLKLKQAAGGMTVEDLNPKHLRELADYFDTDVLEAAKL